MIDQTRLSQEGGQRKSKYIIIYEYIIKQPLTILGAIYGTIIQPITIFGAIYMQLIVICGAIYMQLIVICGVSICMKAGRKLQQYSQL